MIIVDPVCLDCREQEKDPDNAVFPHQLQIFKSRYASCPLSQFPLPGKPLPAHCPQKTAPADSRNA